jgi:hypothetical protein
MGRDAAELIPKEIYSNLLCAHLPVTCVEEKRVFLGQRQVNAGDQVSHACGSAGILGVSVRSTEDRAPLFLGCAHVLAPRDKVTTPITSNVIDSPAAATLCSTTNRIGVLRRVSPFGNQNTIDAATCTLDAGITSSLGVIDGTPISGVLDPRPSVTLLPGRKVWRLNQAGQRIEGTLGDFVSRSIDLLDDMGQTPFTSILIYETPNAPGDSGGAVVDSLTGALVGLHFAGDAGGGGLLCLAYLIFQALYIAWQ